MLRILLALILACYPLLVYFLLENIDSTYLIAAFGILVALRLLLIPGISKALVSGGLLVLASFCVVALLDAQLRLLKLYPVLVNLGIASYAIYTLSHPPSAIERLSRGMGMQVEGPAVVYTRRLTMVWVAFFLINATIAAYTALFAATSLWAWYNGLISYVLIGMLIAGEYPVRLAYQKRHQSN